MTDNLELRPTEVDYNAVRRAATLAAQEAGWSDFSWTTGSSSPRLFGEFFFSLRAATKKVGYRDAYTGKIQLILKNRFETLKRWTATPGKGDKYPTRTAQSIAETLDAFYEQTKGVIEREKAVEYNNAWARAFLEGNDQWAIMRPHSLEDRKLIHQAIGQRYSSKFVSTSGDDGPTVEFDLAIDISTAYGKHMAASILDLIVWYLAEHEADKEQASEKA